jgi:L-fuculokinase
MRPVSAVIDLGKSNKKLLLFDETLNVVEERQTAIPETAFEGGLIQDDVPAVLDWLKRQFVELNNGDGFSIRAINVTTFGATVAHLDERGELALPVLSYTCPTSSGDDDAYRSWVEGLPGGAARTASPVLPNFLNVAKQLFWLKRNRSSIVQHIRHTLFLPQFVVYWLTGQRVSEPTYWGCHTGLWDFETMAPSEHALSGLAWQERMSAPSSGDPGLHLDPERARELGFESSVPVGTGLHDSSSALEPYRAALGKGFVLASTGTWIICLNPDAPFHLTREDLSRDFVYYLTPDRRPVRTARLFGGREHDVQLECIREHFGRAPDLEGTPLEPMVEQFVHEDEWRGLVPGEMHGTGPFPAAPKGEWKLNSYETPETAYARLCLDLAVLTSVCVEGVRSESSRSVVVDGGFARNDWYVRLLATLVAPAKLRIAQVPQATSLGAALRIHSLWTGAPPQRIPVEVKEVAGVSTSGLQAYRSRFVQHLDTQ